MKQNIGELTEAELKACRRFWNKKSFFGEPAKKALERDSMKMRKPVKAMQGRTAGEIRRLNAAPCDICCNWNDAEYLIANAGRADIGHAILTFKIL